MWNIIINRFRTVAVYCNCKKSVVTLEFLKHKRSYLEQSREKHTVGSGYRALGQQARGTSVTDLAINNHRWQSGVSRPVAFWVTTRPGRKLEVKVQREGHSPLGNDLETKTLIPDSIEGL